VITGEWQAPGRCETGTCVEVRANKYGAIEIRTAAFRSPVVATPVEFAAFIAGIKAGQYDEVVMGNRIHRVDTLHTTGGVL
jgi:hypothetical protein